MEDEALPRKKVAQINVVGKGQPVARKCSSRHVHSACIISTTTAKTAFRCIFTEIFAEALGVKEEALKMNNQQTGGDNPRLRRQSPQMHEVRQMFRHPVPSFNEMDYHPHQFVDMVEKGKVEPLMASKSLYMCLSCLCLR